MYLDSPFKVLLHLKKYHETTVTELWQDKEGRTVLLCWTSCLHHAGQKDSVSTFLQNQIKSKVLLIHRIVQMDTCKKSEQRLTLLCETQAEHHHCLHYKERF